ncbi:MAG: hypothetical protein ACYSYW_06470 [Planctomycetota bacterium]|jgi:hypothetical protein
MPEYTDADPRQFRSVVKEWHKRALPNIRTKEFLETWIDFIQGWKKIKWKIGDNPMKRIFERAKKAQPPQVIVELYPDHKGIQKLATLCREIQQEVGKDVWFLSVRTAKRFLEPDISLMTVSRWFSLLAEEEIIKEVSKGKLTASGGVASRYKYIAN